MEALTNQYVIGVDLGGTTVKTGVVGTDGRVIYQNRFPSHADQGPAVVIRQIETGIRDALRHDQAKFVTAIGIGTPGVVDDAGMVKAPPNLIGWDSVPLGREIGERFRGFRVNVENDANAAAIAESKFGAGRECSDFLFVIWGTGIGGGIILKNKLFRGTTGGAGEIGHISIDLNGRPCNCGSRGCIEAYIGQRFLSQRAAERLAHHPGSRVHALVGGDLDRIEPLYLSQAAHDGDPVATEILTEAGSMLGVALAAVMNTMDLRVSVIGGGVSAAGAFVLDAVQRSVTAHVLAPLRPGIRVLQAQLGNTAGILGAAGLVL